MTEEAFAAVRSGRVQVVRHLQQGQEAPVHPQDPQAVPDEGGRLRQCVEQFRGRRFRGRRFRGGPEPAGGSGGSDPSGISATSPSQTGMRTKCLISQQTGLRVHGVGTKDPG
ncbi:hypothetical protein GCM10010363_09770 [Streptomyces omiyaensis]|nr:hypothetical protein GCM10010363_09770 [Streptomyces omiyaensis]